MSNPVDEFLAMKKNAGPKLDALKSFAKSHDIAGKALSGLLYSTAATGATALGIGATKAWNAATKVHDFNRMMKINPDLESAREDVGPDRFNHMYSALRTMNPEFSREPLVAGAYMRKMVDGVADAGTVAANAAGQRPHAIPHPMQEQAMRAFNAGLGSKPEKPEAPRPIGSTKYVYEHKPDEENGLAREERTHNLYPPKS